MQTRCAMGERHLDARGPLPLFIKSASRLCRRRLLAGVGVSLGVFSADSR